jgi:hypothetical protein
MSYGPPPGEYEPQYNRDGAVLPDELSHFTGKGEAIHPDHVYSSPKGGGIPADQVNSNRDGAIAAEFAHTNIDGAPAMVSRLNQPIDSMALEAEARARRMRVPLTLDELNEESHRRHQAWRRENGIDELDERMSREMNRKIQERQSEQAHVPRPETYSDYYDYDSPTRSEPIKERPWVAYAAGALLTVAALVGYNKISDSSADEGRSTTAQVEQPAPAQPEVHPQLPDLSQESLETQAPAALEHLNYWLGTGNPEALSAFNMERTEEQLQELADADIQRLVPGQGAEAPVWRNQTNAGLGNPLIWDTHLVESGTYYADRGNGILDPVNVYIEIEELNGVKEVVWVVAAPPA